VPSCKRKSTLLSFFKGFLKNLAYLRLLEQIMVFHSLHPMPYGHCIERIKPRYSQQNGRHERMHLTLKKSTTKPVGENFLQQQEKFDNFITEYNTERPHHYLTELQNYKEKESVSKNPEQ
jgi:hypothetical protein